MSYATVTAFSVYFPLSARGLSELVWRAALILQFKVRPNMAAVSVTWAFQELPPSPVKSEPI